MNHQLFVINGMLQIIIRLSVSIILILICGDRSFYDLSLNLLPEPSVYRKISFLGYPDVPLSPSVLQDEQFQSLISRPFVLCLTGGGQDGYHLASVFAETLLPQGWTVLFLPVARWLGRK